MPNVATNVRSISAVFYAEQYTNIQAAINALPAVGGTIDARSEAASLQTQGVIDPGGKRVELLLGPYIYNVDRIVVRTGLKISGVSEQMTIIQGTANTTNALISGIGPSAQGCSGCLFENFRMYPVTGFNANPSPSNNLDGFQFNARSSASNGGVIWHSVWNNVVVIGFGGNAWHFLGASAVGELGFHQFLSFYQCYGAANGGSNGPGGNALRMEGAMYQFTFVNCQFDGPIFNSGIDTSAGTTPNIFIGAGPGAGTSGFPYIVDFLGCTSQGREILVQLDGAQDVTFHKTHMEQAYGGFLLTQAANGANVGNYSVTIEESSFNGNVGVNAGNGYVLSVAGADSQGIRLRDNFYAGGFNAPDNWYVTAAAPDAVMCSGNYIQGAANKHLGGAQTGSVVAVYDAVLQSADIPLTTIFTSAQNKGGIYKVFVTAVVTQAATTSSALPSFGIGWTDYDCSLGTGAPAFTTANLANVAGTTLGHGEFMINAKPTTDIKVISYSYASVGATPMLYSVHYRIFFLG